MRGKLMFLGGLAAGFVLGTRAGREKYEELVQAARKVKESPTVQEAAGVVQEQASKLVSGSKEMVADKLSTSRFAETPIGEKVLSAMDTSAGARAIRDNELRSTESMLDDTTLATTPTTGTTGTTSPATTPGTTNRSTGTTNRSTTSGY
jgi:hypothetical protein